MSLKEQLAQIVGAGNVLDAPEVLESHSRDYSLTPTGRFTCVVQPKNAEEVQKVIQLANETKSPITPASSEVHFYGNATPKMGGVVLNLKRMNAIKEIDEASKVAHLDGVHRLHPVQCAEVPDSFTLYCLQGNQIIAVLFPADALVTD